jgi:hypothetical protein
MGLGTPVLFGTVSVAHALSRHGQVAGFLELMVGFLSFSFSLLLKEKKYKKKKSPVASATSVYILPFPVA